MGSTASIDDIERERANMSRRDKPQTETTVFDVEGMCCASEVQLIEHTLGAMQGVEQVYVNLTAASTRVEHASDFEPGAAVDALESVGLSAAPRRAGKPRAPRSAPFWRDRRLLAVIGAAILIAGALASTHLLAIEALDVALYLAATAIGGLAVFRNALTSARRLEMDIHVLMTIAVIGALILGEWLEAASVVVLFAFADWLEGASMTRARRAIGQLMELAPDQARVLRDGVEEDVPVEQVDIGEIVVVRPGEKIPVDGTVDSGKSEVDQSPITGESKPALKKPGDEVFAGTLNQQGSLDIRVDHAPGDTTLAKVIEAVETAQANRSESERFVERFARWYTPAVIAIALLAATIAPLLFAGGWETWFYRSLVLLVIACPCALVLATPITTASALARAARDGILIKGGRFLEQLGRTRAVAFDKTGTLTRGEPVVVEVVAIHGVDEDALVAAAALAESRSEHYLARAIRQAARQRDVHVDSDQLVSFEAHVGRGVEALVRPLSEATSTPSGCCDSGCGRDSADPDMNTERVLVGSRRLLAEHEIGCADVERQWAALEDRGHTVVGVARGGALLGLIAIEDAPREQARATIDALKSAGIADIYMLTGDNARSAHSIAEHVGLSEDAVLADLLPGEKVDAVEKLTREHAHVAMVGDGINDAPALAAAPVGIAMGAAGTDIALDTAHVALMADDLERLPQAIDLGERTGKIIVQNIALALGIKVGVFALAAVGIATLWMAVLADMGTSLLVIFNGMRMLRAAKKAPTGDVQP